MLCSLSEAGTTRWYGKFALGRPLTERVAQRLPDEQIRACALTQTRVERVAEIVGARVGGGDDTGVGLDPDGLWRRVVWTGLNLRSSDEPCLWMAIDGVGEPGEVAVLHLAA